MKRIFLFFLLVSTAFSMRAQQASYTISLQEAVWNFDDYEGTKPSVSSSSYLVPQNWIIGNGGSSNNSPAYCPFIYPYTGDATSSSASKVTVYAYYPDLIALFKWDVLISSNAGTTFVAADILDSINTYDPNTTIDGISSGFIEEISVNAPDGVTYDGATAQAASESGMGYWMYNLNDQLAPSGIAGQTIVAGDVIFWEFKTDWSNWELTQLANVPSNVYSVDFGVVNAAPIQHDTTAISCGAFTWEGQTYTQSGDYSINKQTANGTEQLTLHLTINQSYYFEEYLTACDSMEWQGTTYTESGDYTFNDTTVSGCDSTTVLHLTINKSTYEERSETHTDSLIWNGQILKESGDYTFSDTTVNGCDSTIVLHLTIEPTSALSNTTLQVAVWPNPTTEVLHLQAEGGTEIYIFDATGQLVIRQPYADTLNVSTLPSGMYLIRLQTTNGQTATTPFIKK